MQVLRVCRWAFSGLLSLLVYATAAWAQQTPPADPADDKGSWVLSYALVILGIALGLMAVCRPGNRTKDVKIAADE
jgi:hypothetical protein